MFRRILGLALAGLLASVTCVSQARVSSDESKQVRLAGKVKKEIARLGVGPDARVEVKLYDGTKVKGYVSEIADEYFVVTDAKTGAATRVVYPQVKQLDGRNNKRGLTRAAGFAFAGAVIVGVVVLLGLAGLEN
jgi:ribosomal protein S28E/S33